MKQIIKIALIFIFYAVFNLKNYFCLADDHQHKIISDNFQNATNGNHQFRRISSRSRKKRFAAFPEGSSLSFAFGIHQGVVGSMFGYATMGTVYGTSYLLPNKTWTLEQVRNLRFGKSEADHEVFVKRRSRRDLYHKLELIIDNLGFNGRDCILRTLCESQIYFAKSSTNMIMEFLKTIFTFPIAKSIANESHEDIDYSHAYQQGHHRSNCLKYNYNCEFSLLDLALGNFIK